MENTTISNHHHQSNRKQLYKRMASDTDLWLGAKGKSVANRKLQGFPEDGKALGNEPASFKSTASVHTGRDVSLLCFGHENKANRMLMSANWIEEEGIIINHVEMPKQEEQMSKKVPFRKAAPKGHGMPTPTNKRVLDQEEFDKRLKAKQALFSSKKSLSLASFKLPTPKKIHVHIPFEKFSKIHSAVSADQRDLKQEKAAGDRLHHSKDPSAAGLASDKSYLAENSAKGELDLLEVESLINIEDVARKLSGASIK